MKVLIADHIDFLEDDFGKPYAEIRGSYKISDMTTEEFYTWSDNTSEDWITPEYEGKIYYCQAIRKDELFA